MHAKGPWKIRPKTGIMDPGRQETVIEDADGWSIARMQGTWSNAQDNERLVAAAPELAAALLDLVQWCEDHGKAPVRCGEARAALAKAGL